MKVCNWRRTTSRNDCYYEEANRHREMSKHMYICKLSFLTVYALRNVVGFSARQDNFLSNPATEEGFSATSLDKNLACTAEKSTSFLRV